MGLRSGEALLSDSGFEVEARITGNVVLSWLVVCPR